MPLPRSTELLSHHANLLIGGNPVKAGLISMLEKKYRMKTRGNPDFYDREYETLTINDVRELKFQANTRPATDSKGSLSMGAGKKIFVLQMNGATVEAQNALLKLLEEPPEYARFFMVIPSAHLLLPTVKSRLSIIDIGSDPDMGDEGGSSAEIAKEASVFLKASPAERLEMIKSLTDSIYKEKKTKQDAIDLLNAIEEAVHAGGVEKNVKSLEAIETARAYMNDRSPSMKMLLEYVALNT